MSSDPIIIAGAGIGGLTTAIALARRGFEAVVLERAPEIRASGSGITLQTNAMVVMEELGLAADLRAVGATLEVGSVRTTGGTVLQEMALDVEPPGLALHRQRLLNVLADHNDAPVRFDAGVVGFGQDDDGVEVELRDGTTIRGAALLGCDGLHSTVRVGLLGDTPLVYAGYTTWRGVCRDGASLDAGTTELWGVGERFGIVPIGQGEVYWFAVADAEPGGEDGPSPTAELLERFAGWMAPVEALLRGTRDEDVIRTDTDDRDPIDTWVDGRVGLLGDAAHPMTPNLGQGAGQAIEDALAVANALATADGDVRRGLVAYQQCRLERANWFVKQSRRMGRVAHWTNPVIRAVRNLGFRLTPASVTRRSVERMYTPVVEPRIGR